MMTLVGIRRLHELRFDSGSVSVEELRRWCVEQRLPAVKMGRRWMVDLDAFDASIDPGCAPVVDKDAAMARGIARRLFGKRSKAA